MTWHSSLTGLSASGIQWAIMKKHIAFLCSISNTKMSLESLRRAKKGITNVEKDNRDHSPPISARENQLQIVSVSPFKLPDDWLIEERPRLSPNPSHRVDRVI